LRSGFGRRSGSGLGKATLLPMQCPSCAGRLESECLRGQSFERCLSCRGEWFTHDALHALLSAQAPQPPARPAAYRRPSPFSDPVRYRKCPSCDQPMLRRNFRESSGVVVDVCAAHGLWLDRGELASLLEFAGTGAMAEADRLGAERADARKRLDAWSEDLRSMGPRHYGGGPHGAMIPLDAIASLGRVPGVDPDDD
jgi:Zn-finger nucleic acid-binding protein